MREKGSILGEHSESKGFAHILVLLLLLGGLVAGVYLVTSGNPLKLFSKASESDAQSKRINDLTGQLVQKRDAYNNLTKAGKVSVQVQKETIDNLTAVAIRRKEELKKEAENNPKAFLKDASLVNQRSSFPKEIQGYLEDQADLVGKLIIWHVDNFAEKTSLTKYYIKLNDRKLSIYSTGGIVSTGLSGSKIQVKGISLDDLVVLNTNDELSEQENFKVIEAAAQAVGNHQALALLINFQNDSSQPLTKGQVTEMLFGNSNTSLNKYLQESSYNQVSLSGEVAGWYTIPFNNSSPPCTFNDTETWSLRADEMAKADGVEVDNYSHLIYFFSDAPCLREGGFGTVGGAPSRSGIFINKGSEFYTRYVYIHEFGHNLGLEHAGSFECGNKIIDIYANCTPDVHQGPAEYGDPFDVMGASSLWTPQFNGPHKLQLNWFSSDKVLTVSSSGIYKIYPLESNLGPQVIKVSKPDTNEYYYLEYRQPIGLDNGFPVGITRGVSIHLWRGAGNKTKLLDLSPETRGNFLDAAGQDNFIFADPQNKLTIKQTSHNSSYVEVEITLNADKTSLITDWTVSQSYPELDRSNFSLVSNNSYVWLIGGDVGGSPGNGTQTNKVYYAKLNSDGLFGNCSLTSIWCETTSLPNGLIDHSSALYNGYIYVTGGRNYLGVQAKIYFARINLDGTLGEWSTSNIDLPKELANHSSVAIDGYLIIIGGYSSREFQDNAFWIKISPEGALSNCSGDIVWCSNKLPRALHGHSSLAYKDSLFTLGGIITGGASSIFYSSKITGSGEDFNLGPWTTANMLSRATSSHASVIVGDNIIVLGGQYHGKPLSSVDISSLDANGDIVEWKNAKSLPQALNVIEAFFAGNYLHVIGGVDADNARVNKIYSARLQNIISPLPSPSPTPQPTSSSSPTPSPSPLTQTISLSSGYNLIGLTVDKGSGYKAANLASDLNSAQAGTVTQISKWVNGAWQTHIVNFPANNFDIKPGEGYLIKASRYAQINLSGAKAALTSLAIGPGFNSISFPEVPASLNTAEKLVNEMKKQGINISTLSRWKDGGWKSYVPGFPAGSFDLQAGEGYYLKSSTNEYKQFNIPASSSQVSAQVVAPTSKPSFSCTPCLADVNKDKKVNISDYSLWAYCRVRSINSSPRCPNADLDKDGRVGGDPEFKCINSQMGKKC